MKQKNTFFRTPIALAILFILFVIVPGIVLSAISVRSLSRENAFLEEQFSSALMIEMKPAVVRVESELETIKLKLDSAFALGERTFEQLESVETNAIDSLLEVQFELGVSKDIISPEFTSKSSESVLQFFRFNRDFFQDRVPVTVVRKIPIKTEVKTKAVSKSDYFQSNSMSKDSKENYLSSSKSQEIDKLSQFKQQFSGKKEPSSRTISKIRYQEKIEHQIRMEESKHFSQIIQEKKSGFILREIDGEQMLLYYFLHENGTIRGAVISRELLANMLSQQIPLAESDERRLVITDQNNSPIANDSLGELGEPLVKLSLGSYLVQWNLAAYLTDPTMIDRKAFQNKLTLGFMIAFLMISLSVGGVIIVRSIMIQVREAEQKTTFVANVSHELKTPLTSIRLFAELLQQNRQTDPQKRQRYLSILVSESERLTRLINNVLDFSRGNKGERRYDMRELDLLQLLTELIEHQRIRLEHKGFTVEIDFPENPILVFADGETLKQVLLNLLSNAEKYSDAVKWIRIALMVQDQSVLIFVEDRGIGIDPSLRNKIFAEFFRVDTSLTATVQGTGLGLTISRTIIQDHGGEISCSENPEGGSRFTITLPQIAKNS